MAKNLTDVLVDNGFTPEERGGKRVIVCPFHQGDNDPSFTIYPNETYYCFGCKAWGDAVKFLIEFKGLTRDEAFEYVGIDYKVPNSDKKKIIKLRNTIDAWKLLGQATKLYHENLFQTQGALDYLYSRGLSDETIRKFKLGYTDGYVLNLKYAEDYKLGVEIGLVNKSGYEMLSHRITIPNLLDHNEVDFISGRTVINDKIRYLNTRGSKPVQGFFEVRHSPVILLVEGQMDWLILRQWGYPAVVMAGSHMTKVNQYLLENKALIIVPDNDEVGRKMAEETKNRFKNVTVLDYEAFGTKDIGEMAQTVDNARFIFRELVKEQAAWTLLYSTEILARYLPALASEIYSPLTLKQPV